MTTGQKKIATLDQFEDVFMHGSRGYGFVALVFIFFQSYLGNFKNLFFRFIFNVLLFYI